MSSKQNTVIIGAGPAGLSAAYQLYRKGIPAVVVEASDHLGGISQTVGYKGYRFDLGGHRFFTNNPFVESIWKDILDGDLLTCHRKSRIFFQGRFFHYPLKISNVFTQLSVIEISHVILSYLKARLSARMPADDFEGWVSNRFGHRLFTIFFKSYTEKVWGIPCNEISSEWAAQRIKNLSLVEAVRNALWGQPMSQNGQTILTLIDTFYYPRLGPGMFWEKMAENMNVPIVKKSGVTGIHHKNNIITFIECEGRQKKYHAGNFVSSMPLNDLIFALKPAVPAEILEAAKQLKHRGHLLIGLILKKEQILDDHWLYIHSPEIKMGRIQFYKNWSSEMVADPQTTTVGLEYFYSPSDPEWTAPDKYHLDLGIRECSLMGLFSPQDVVDGLVVRTPHAYPVYDSRYKTNVEMVLQYLKRFKNLYLIGRNGLHRYDNMDQAMWTGILAARRIAKKETRP
jgi:protoporphyrinogen oxidase